MIFLHTAKELSYLMLASFTVLAVLAHLLRWSWFSYPRMFGYALGVLIVVSLTEQFHLSGIIRAVVTGVLVPPVGYVFSLLQKYRPLNDAA